MRAALFVLPQIIKSLSPSPSMSPTAISESLRLSIADELLEIKTPLPLLAYSAVIA